MIKIGNFKKPTEQPNFQRGQKERHDARSGHSGTLLYFAYGSNMNRNQMAFRCPDAEVAGSVRLEGYRLAFRENGGGVGVATVLPEPDSFVTASSGAFPNGMNGVWTITRVFPICTARRLSP